MAVKFAREEAERGGSDKSSIEKTVVAAKLRLWLILKAT